MTLVPFTWLAPGARQGRAHQAETIVVTTT